MYKNEKGFDEKYQKALVVVGLGIYIIEQIFNQHGTPTPHTQILEDKDSCIRAWASVLANGIDIPAETIITDATKIFQEFQVSFVNSRETQYEIQRLVPHMSRAGAIPRF